MNPRGGTGYPVRAGLSFPGCWRPILFVGLLMLAGCAQAPLAVRPAVADPASLSPSSRLIVGRILAVDAPNRFAFVALAFDPPAVALAPGVELIVRTLDLQETARLQASRYVRGKTLGTTIVSGRPAPGDEVVWHAP